METFPKLEYDAQRKIRGCFTLLRASDVHLSSGNDLSSAKCLELGGPRSSFTNTEPSTIFGKKKRESQKMKPEEEK